MAGPWCPSWCAAWTPRRAAHCPGHVTPGFLTPLEGGQTLPAGKALSPSAPALWHGGPGGGGGGAVLQALASALTPPAPPLSGLLSCSTLARSLPHPGSAHVYMFPGMSARVRRVTSTHILERKAPACQDDGSKDEVDKTKDYTRKHRVIREYLRAFKRKIREEACEQRKVADKEGLSCHRLKPGQSLQLCQLLAQPRSPGALALEVKMELVG